MRVMAMDTATDVLGVGVSRLDGTLASGVVQRIPRGHSTLLQPSVQFVMTSANLKMIEIERIGVGIGPGSYTGVRMAVATGKAMAHALNRPLVAIPTLDAIALAAMLGVGQGQGDASERDVLVLLNARRQRAFGAGYRFCGTEMLAHEDAVVRETSEWFSRASDDTIVIHDFTAEDRPETMDKSLRFVAWSDICGLLPEALVRLAGSTEYPEYTGDALHALEPDYALPVEAQAKRMAKSGEVTRREGL